MALPVICKFDDDPIKNEGAIVSITLIFPHYKSMEKIMTFKSK